MSRFTKKQYRARVLAAMAFYTGFMLLAWPLVRTTASFPLKACLALVPVVPMMYVIGLMFRRIQNSDELEQRTHLISLGVATAVLGVVSLVGGFLCAGGVIRLDGTELIFVFPLLMFCYSMVRARVLRSYGVDQLCEDEGFVPRYVWFVLGGFTGLVAAWLSRHSLDSMSLGFLCGAGGGFVLLGLASGVARWRRKGLPHD